jgi:hypothetical protein
MKRSASNTTPAQRRNQAQVRISYVVAVAILAVAGFGAVRYFRQPKPPAVISQDSGPTLSPGTDSVLKALKSPIEIRFYSLLDPASTPESTRAFSERVKQLLAKYERDGKGNIRVVSISEMTDANAKAAAADGIRSFNREKGEASYLGIAAVRDGQSEALAELSPDWESALESDLSRVVGRVNDMVPPNATPANVSGNELATAQKAIASNPALASATPEQATQMLRDQALADFKAAVIDMQNQTKAAEQRLAQGAASEAEIAGEIQKIQADQTAKMQEITARLHNQIAALAQNKGAAH